MNLKTFSKHIDSKSIYNPYDLWLKISAKRKAIDRRLLTTQIYIGNSCTDVDHNYHHVFDRNLFPIKSEYGVGTLRIVVSRRTHEQLHKRLAACKTFSDFCAYEGAIKAECPDISGNIAEEYCRRIKSLRFGLCIALRVCLNRIFKIMR